MKTLEKTVNLGITSSLIAVLATSILLAKSAQADCISVYEKAVQATGKKAVLCGEVCGAVVTLPVAAPMAINYALRAKEMRKVLSLLKQARVGFGMTLEKFFREVTSGNYPSRNTTFKEMLEILNYANASDALCTPTDELPKYNFIRDSFRSGILQEGLGSMSRQFFPTAELGPQIPETMPAPEPTSQP